MLFGKNGIEAISLYKTYQPDILLMDIRMEQMDGLEAGQQILNQFPDARILYLTTFLDDEYIVKALNMGAKGYLLKQDFHSLPTALESILSGQVVFGKDIVFKFSDLMTNDLKEKGNDFGLTQKEKEVIELVAQGLSNKEIANKLFLSEGTLRNYISQVLAKLSLRDRTQLVIFYFNYLK